MNDSCVLFIVLKNKVMLTIFKDVCFFLLCRLVVQIDLTGLYEECINCIAIPTALRDISTKNYSLVIAALNFLGRLLLVVKLPLDVQAMVIGALTTKLSKVSENNQTRSLMWSLANIQFDKQLQESYLSKMLDAACMFLLERNSVNSLSTVSESLNTLLSIGVRNIEFCKKNLARILSTVMPWLFNKDNRIRELSLQCLEPFTTNIAEHKLLDVTLQDKLRSKHYTVLSQLVSTQTKDSLKIWSFLVKAFGTQLLESKSIRNELLKIEESALRCKNLNFRKIALEHWRDIIDCFALKSTVLKDNKIIKLSLVPLNFKYTSSVYLSKIQIKLWWHLLNRLGPDAICRFQEVGLPLLIFCFGTKDEKQDESKGMALIFSKILPLATTVLTGFLSSETKFEEYTADNVLLSRSLAFMSSENFTLDVANFSHWCLLSLELKSTNDNEDVYHRMILSFIERCSFSKLIEPLQAFIHSLFEKATVNPNLMEFIYDVLTDALKFNLFVELLTKNLSTLLQWFVKNHTFSDHPIYRFLHKLFETGINWNVQDFTSSVVQYLTSLNKQQQTESNSAVADLWSKIASALTENNNCIHLPSVHQQFLLLPLTWSCIKSEKSIFHDWSLLLAAWAKADPSIITAVINPEGEEEVNVNISTIRSVLYSIRSEFISYSRELSSWITKWTISWLKLANVAEVGRMLIYLFCFS